MVIGVVKISIYTPWVHSLKEKRMVVKSICAKISNKFNVSVAEVEEQDTHQTTVIGLACIADEAAHADRTIDHILNFIESNTEGDIVSIDREII